MTAGSRAYPDSRPAGFQNPGSTAHLLQPFPGWSSHVGMPPQPLSSVCRTACLVHAAPPLTGWPLPRLEHHSPFGPAPLQRLPPYYQLFCPCASHRYSKPDGVRPLDSLPSHRSDRFPRSVKEPAPDSRRLRAGRHKGRTSGLRPYCPRGDHHPRFRRRLYYFGSSSTVRFRSSLWTLPDGILSHRFRDAHHHRS